MEIDICRCFNIIVFCGQVKDSGNECLSFLLSYKKYCLTWGRYDSGSCPSFCASIPIYFFSTEIIKHRKKEFKDVVNRRGRD